MARTPRRPYLETGLDLFSADRCMAERNFPVKKKARPGTPMKS
ncbi:MAG: hypothetical protein P4L71_20160 [Acetobacteraceae bacterium]|nr:hypothetical protein [Acetobacteraceae bacterium]